MCAIASLNTDIHQLCLYILGGSAAKQCFSPQNFLLSVAQSALFLAAPGSAWLHLRRAVLTSVASVEEYDD